MIHHLLNARKLQAMIGCRHTTRTPCQLRRRPGDIRKACWEVCHNCGAWLSCNC